MKNLFVVLCWSFLPRNISKSKYFFFNFDEIIFQIKTKPTVPRKKKPRFLPPKLPPRMFKALDEEEDEEYTIDPRSGHFKKKAKPPRRRPPSPSEETSPPLSPMISRPKRTIVVPHRFQTKSSGGEDSGSGGEQESDKNGSDAEFRPDENDDYEDDYGAEVLLSDEDDDPLMVVKARG